MMKEESRIVKWRVKTFGSGLLKNPMSEDTGFLLDTGDA